MKKIAVLILSFLGASFLLSLFIMQRIERAVPGKIQFISTSLWDPWIVYLAMMAGIMVVFVIVLGTGKILSKKLKWGKWKTRLVYSMQLCFWALIFWAAYFYSIHRIKNFAQASTQLSVGPLMLSLKAFVFYLLRNILLFGVMIHLILVVALFWVWILKRKKQKRADHTAVD